MAVGSRLHVALHARDLACQEDAGAGLQGAVGIQDGRCIDIGVAVHAPKAHELGMLEPWDKPEDPGLLGIGELGLAAHEVAGLAVQALHPELEQRPRTPARPRIRETHRLQRTKAERLGTALGKGLHGHAALEVPLLFKLPALHLFRRAEGLVEAEVLFPVHGTVQVVALV